MPLHILPASAYMSKLRSKPQIATMYPDSRNIRPLSPSPHRTQHTLAAPPPSRTQISFKFSFYNLFLVILLLATAISHNHSQANFSLLSLPLQESSTIMATQVVIPAARPPSLLALSSPNSPAASCPTPRAASSPKSTAASYPNSLATSYPTLRAESSSKSTAASCSSLTSISCPSSLAASSLIFQATRCHNLSSSLISKPPARPNTTLHYTLFTPHSSPMPQGQLNQDGWKRLGKDYPDRAVVNSILGICQFGARIGYIGERDTIRIHPNLSSASECSELVTAEIHTELEKKRIRQYRTFSSLPLHYIASPLGLTDKSDGTKRRIHHLSYPTNSSESINNGIPELYGTISYSTISEAVSAIQEFGERSQLVKRDFESAFRHIPVSPIDAPLLGFHWNETYYEEQFLPFGLRTAPYIFNLFAEVFHWILERQLHQTSARISLCAWCAGCV